jgi:hypothetical protein
MKKFLLAMAALVGLGLLGEATSPAQEQHEGVIYQKKTVYNFEDDTITGDLTKPDQEFLTGRKLAHHKSLIRIREHFREKIIQSAKGL